MTEMSYTEDDIKEALLAICQGKHSAIDTSKKYNIPVDILEEKLFNLKNNEPLGSISEKTIHCNGDPRKNSDEDGDFSVQNGNIGDHGECNLDIFNHDQICELIEIITSISSNFSRIDEVEAQRIIFEYADLKKIRHHFNTATRKTGNEWYQKFLSSHPSLNSAIKESDGIPVLNGNEAESSPDAVFSSQAIDKFLSDYQNGTRIDEKVQESKESENEKYLNITTENPEISKLPVPVFCNNVEQITECEIDKHRDEDDNTSNIVDTSLNLNLNDSTNSVKNNDSPDTSLVDNRLHTVPVDSKSTKTEESINDEFLNVISSVNSNLSPLKEAFCGLVDDGNCEVTREKEKSDCNVENKYLSESCGTKVHLGNSDSTIISAELSNVAGKQVGNCVEHVNDNSNEFAEKYPVNEKVTTNPENDLSNFHEADSTCNSKVDSKSRETVEDESTTVDHDSTLEKECIEENMLNSSDCVKNKNDVLLQSDDNLNKSKPPITLNENEDSLVEKINQKDEKKAKIIFKTRKTSSIKKAKKTKYFYKLKSYNGSVLYFTSPTSVSFIKPVIKLTKLDENLSELPANEIASRKSSSPVEVTRDRDSESCSQQGAISSVIPSEVVASDTLATPVATCTIIPKEETSVDKKSTVIDEGVTPTFSMQTRKKRLKFLPDGTLVSPNHQQQHHIQEVKSSCPELKKAKKRSIKILPQDTPRPLKKMKNSPNSSKQENRPIVEQIKTNKPKKPQQKYIPKPNGQSKKPQKIFDYDSYYREHYRQTEVKLPANCKKQTVALSRVTSISQSAKSGKLTVNPAQLLSCLLGMPIGQDQIRTVRFKPPAKQIRPKSQVNISPSKLASNNDIEPITKRQLELLQKTPFNIVPKTEIGVTKSTKGSVPSPISKTPKNST